MFGTHRELSNRVNNSGRDVIQSFKSFMSGEGGFRSFKNEFKDNQNENTQGQLDKLDHKVQVLREAVDSLERSIQISNDPRLKRGL